MKTDRKKSVFLALLLMTAGAFCTGGAVRAAVLEMPETASAQSSAASETGETQASTSEISENTAQNAQGQEVPQISGQTDGCLLYTSPSPRD